MAIALFSLSLFFIVGGPTADKRLEESNDDADRKSFSYLTRNKEGCLVGELMRTATGLSFPYTFVV